ncbi:2,3-diketo-L-gulonate TRAP transporter small permease protein YiaM [Variibacter gotjawalensis]|jgi:TRAP-type transport system small permease protein|uniref:TRAP transporter small permease protein n=1 Tax=Variibacter gotjawalensis TaxID=1333996 RepID=A0A0S3PVH9_9BRAD|nr:TRAP transporter small permease [Variibacter gotjawalensis]NIK45774.1 TRAP-type C4-dicarboxylate transport system permease small subunit [Variibacter gotjawalensis]RZS47698.1 TRAP-type C4-dicarboxylate transport system permease small subunit [Variibacter gotjawalensis]BAT59951.1 2,3-diketo-L-gulonate TRAP transporter small permease protein YiaM [Variibacter gotjawalensis]
MLQRIDRIVVAANRLFLIVVLAAMSVIVFVNVCMRYLTTDSLVWAEEVARYLMCYLTFLGLGLVYRYGGHIGVDSLQKAVPDRAATILRAISVAIVIAFCAAMAWYGAIYADRTSVQSTPVTEIPFSYIAASVPLGFALALWHIFAVARGLVIDGKYQETPDADLTQAGSL